MSLRKKLLRNLAVLAALFLLAQQMMGLHLTPLTALHAWEAGRDYLPSTVLLELDIPDGKYALATRGNCFVFYQSKRVLGVFWRCDDVYLKYLEGAGPLEYVPVPLSPDGTNTAVLVRRYDPAVEAQFTFRDGREPVAVTGWQGDWCAIYLADTRITEIDRVRALGTPED